MTSKLKHFLHSHGISTSRTTPYNPEGNSQCERCNGVIWKNITLALKSRSLSIPQWEHVLADALHSIRSLLLTAAYVTPHERLFNYQRRSMSRCSIPTWLSSPGSVLLKRHVRQSKYDPVIEEVELLETNPRYAHVRYPDGKETTVALRDLAPRGEVHNSGDVDPPVHKPPGLVMEET